MSDRISPEHRSWNMAQIKGKDTKIEVKVRKYLFSKGFRFRKNDKRYPGKPDVVLPKYKTAIFINGCFWHMHKGCKMARLPKTNTDFWSEKLSRNVQNDKIHIQQLIEMGWTPITLWECELEKNFEKTMSEVVDRLQSQLLPQKNHYKERSSDDL